MNRFNSSVDVQHFDAQNSVKRKKRTCSLQLFGTSAAVQNIFKNQQAKFNLKLVSAIFHQIFIFSPNDSPSKIMKNAFYFILKPLSLLKIFTFL